MRRNWHLALAIGTLVALAACGSYSAPNSSTAMGPDSTGDTTHMTPPPTGYIRTQ